MDISNVSSAMVSGLEGIKSAEQGIEQASVNINKLHAERDVVAQTDLANDQNENAPRESVPAPVSLSAEAVNLVVNEHLAKANVNVIKTADDVVGTLIDTKV